MLKRRIRRGAVVGMPIADRDEKRAGEREFRAAVGVMDEAGETEIAGSFDHVLSLAQWISRVCDITPCIANGVIQATREASRRAAG